MVFFFFNSAAQTWSQLNNQAFAYYKSGELDKAISTAEKAIEEAAIDIGKDHASYASCLIVLGFLCSEAKQYEKSESAFIQAVESCEKRKDQNGLCAGIYNQLANLYTKTEKYEKAEIFYIKDIENKKKFYGRESIQLGTSLNNLAGLYFLISQYDKAIPVYEQAEIILKKTLGEEHAEYATILNNLGTLYSNMGEYNKAEPYLLKAAEIRKKLFGTDHLEYVNTLSELAILYKNNGKYSKAEPLFILVKEIKMKILGEDDPDYATSLNNLGALYSNMGEFSKAEILLIKGLEIIKKHNGDNHSSYAYSLNNLAVLYKEMGQYSKAEPLLIRATDIRKKIFGENHPAYAGSLNNLATLYEVMGQYEKSEILYLQAEKIIRQASGETHPDYASTLNNLAFLYTTLGRYPDAEFIYLKSITLRKKVLGESHPDYASSLNNLGALYSDLGQKEKAELLIVEAKEIRKKVLGEEHPDYGSSLNNLALLYKGLGKYDKAEQLYLDAIRIQKKSTGEADPLYASSLSNLGLLYKATGRNTEALELLKQVAMIRKNVFGENHPAYANSLNNLAAIYMYIGVYQKAESLFISATDISKRVFGETHSQYAINLNNLAILYSETGQYAKAEPLWLENSRINLKNLTAAFAVLSEKEKNNYIKNNISEINANNSFLYYYRKASAAILRNNFNLSLFLKSITLADVRNTLESIRQSADSNVQKTFYKWQTLRKFLSKQYQLSIADRIQSLDSIENVAEVFEKNLTRESSVFRNKKSSLHISMQEVQQNLQNEEAAVEFVSFQLYNKKWTDSIMYAAYVLRKNDSVPIFIPLCEEKQLQKLFDSAGTTATAMVSKFYRGLELINKNVAGALGTELYKLIWQPLEPYLKGIKKISYSPAGKLYSIAFHALPVDSNTVLMDKFQLQQYTSTRQVALRTLEDQNPKPGNITLFGNASFTMDSLQLVKQKMNQPGKENISTSIYTPQKRSSDNNTWNNLPGTEEEVNKIIQLFDLNKISNKSFTQTTASEENLKALSGKSPQILHIATHGFFLPEPDKKRKETSFNNENTYTLADDPLLRSGLILAGGNYAWSGKTPIDGVEDGIATAYEISQLNLSNTELVVLSACETALGDVKGSEGVFGLQRAFKMAGVKKMIVSLWQVPDKETAELMTAFYGYWMKGKSINDAFTQAQADMRKKYAPFYWAAFVLVE
ncbi:MAG: CHAT domain-containing protein [Chitinophagaceae bacterium]|nr:CHAT domain-containing protein [Chitinophagaceae bacterium]